MELRIVGHHLPGRQCPGHTDVHVGIQIRRDPAELVPADVGEVYWTTEITVLGDGTDRDFRGPAVQGKRGERFVYLTWGDGTGTAFTLFRRAKLMLNDVPTPTPDLVTATVHLTDDKGMPRCARLKPPALEWS